MIRKRIQVLLMAVVSFGFVASQVAQAQQQSSGLQVSPTRSELTVDAGSSVSFEVDIKNVTQGEIVTKVSVDDFIPNDDGSPKIYPNSDEKHANSIKDFIKNLTPSTIAPGVTTKLNLTAEVPAGQAPGAYYGVVRFQAVPSDSSNTTGGGQVALSASVGHIVLIQVPGNITEKLQLVSVKVDRNDKIGTLFSNVPTESQITIKNTGNSFLKPFGSVSVEKNGKQVYSYQINNEDTKANVIPSSQRVFKHELKDLKGFGRYKLIANVTYGNGGDVLTQQVTFWVIPVWLAAIIAIAVLVLVGAVLYVIRRIKNRR